MFVPRLRMQPSPQPDAGVPYASRLADWSPGLGLGSASLSPAPGIIGAVRFPPAIPCGPAARGSTDTLRRNQTWSVRVIH
jgi:hypothetical protein